MEGQGAAPEARSVHSLIHSDKHLPSIYYVLGPVATDVDVEEESSQNSQILAHGCKVNPGESLRALRQGHSH